VAKTKTIIKKKYITERTTNRMTRNFGFLPLFGNKYQKQREREKKTHEPISSRRRIGRRI
jgi:hypothetical protein